MACNPTDKVPEIGKTEWPELVGKKGEDAVAIIKSENSNMRDVFTILEGTPVTKDLKPDRVRVWVNDCGNVVTVPKAG